MSDRTLKVLIIPGWFPGALDRNTGDFILKQAKDLAKSADMQVLIAHAELSYRFWNRPKYWLRKRTFEEQDGITIYRYTGLSLPRVKYRIFHLWRNQILTFINSIIDEIGEPDVIHAHTFLGGFIAAGIKAKRPHIPVVVTEHSDLLFGVPQRYKKIVVDAYEKADRVIAPSQALAHQIDKWRGGTPLMRIPMSVDEKYFYLPFHRRKIVQPIQLITVSELVPVKNVALQIEVLDDLIQSQYPAELTIVGDGPSYISLHRLAKEHDVLSYVHFKGWKEPHDVANLLRASDIYLSTSRRETFGLSILEALSCGIPVVSTRSGGPEDMISDRNGLLVDSDRRSLSHAIRRVVEKIEINPTYPFTDADLYSWESVAKRLYILYTDLQ